MLQDFHSSFQAGKLQSVAASAAAFVGGEDGADHLFAVFDHFRGVFAVEKAVWLVFPG